MKKIFFALLVCLLPLSMYVYAGSKIQHGVVRTVARAEHAGQTVNGVIIHIEGEHNPVITDEEGHFEIRFDFQNEGDVFRIGSVRKANYEILDPSLLGRALVLSSKVPMTIIVVNKMELERERAQMIANFERKFSLKYEQRVQKIEEEYNQKRITLEQRIQKLEEVDHHYEALQNEMSEMVNRYLRTDYEMMDSIDRVINSAIEQGDFDTAKQVILSKGNVQDRVQNLLDLEKRVRTNEEALRELRKKQDDLAQVLANNTQQLVSDLLNLYDIEFSNSNLDSAKVILDQMLLIAPENIDVLIAACSYSIFAYDYLTAMHYGQKRARLIFEGHKEDYDLKINVYYGLATLYEINGRPDSALVYFKKAQDVICRYKGDTCNMLAGLYQHIGSIYANLSSIEHATDSARYYCQKVLDFPIGKENTSSLYDIISRSYSSDKDYDNALRYNQLAIATDSDSHWLAYRYRRRAEILQEAGDTSSVLPTLYEAMKYVDYPAENLNILNMIERHYRSIDQLDSAFVYINKQVDYAEKIYGKYHMSYLFHLLGRAQFYRREENYALSEVDFNFCVESIIQKHPQEFLSIAIMLYNRGELYKQIGRKDAALADFHLAAEYLDKMNFETNLTATVQTAIQSLE